MGGEIIHIQDIVKNLGDIPIGIFEETDDTDLLSILQREQETIGLSGVIINLLVPDEESYTYGSTAGCCFRSNDERYAIVLIPATIKRVSFRGHSTECVLTERAITHELAHIKNGDCDVKLPRIIRFFYNWLIAEPRAQRYVFNREINKSPLIQALYGPERAEKREESEAKP